MTKIYLISPPKIDDFKEFSLALENCLKTNLVPVFQLRLKGCEDLEIAKKAQEIKKICHDNNCLFVLNDKENIAIDIGADGVHVGIEDNLISKIRAKVDDNFIIGASCYDSRHLAFESAEQGASYISFGAFFESPTKKSRGKPNPEILKWANEIMNLPTVAIGGINPENCAELVKNKADFIAVISYIWQNKGKEAENILKLSNTINSIK